MKVLGRIFLKSRKERRKDVKTERRKDGKTERRKDRKTEIRSFFVRCRRTYVLKKTFRVSYILLITLSSFDSYKTTFNLNKLALYFLLNIFSYKPWNMETHPQRPRTLFSKSESLPLASHFYIQL